VGLAGAGVTEQADRGAGADPVAGGQRGDGGRVDGGVGGVVEVLQPFCAGEGGVVDAAGAAAFVSGVALGQQQFGEQAGVGVLFAFGRGDRLAGAVADGGQVQGAAGGLDAGGRGMFAEPGPAPVRPRCGPGRPVGRSGSTAVAAVAGRVGSVITRAPAWWGVSRLPAARRASTATSSGLAAPRLVAAAIPATTAAAGRWRCSRSTSISARVPAASPRAARAAAQNASWAGVNTPAARAWARAAAPGQRAGLTGQDLQVVVQHEDLAASGAGPLVPGHQPRAVEGQDFPGA
jgi:hypothetical protein